MKALAKFFSLFAATCFAFLTPSKAQIQTYDTRPFYSGSVVTFGSGTTIGETFANVLAVQKMTYNFFPGSGSPSTGDTLTAVFGEWNNTTASFVGGTTVTLTGNAFVPAPGIWGTPGTNLNNTHGSFPTFAYSFDLSNVGLWTQDTPSLLNNTNGYSTNPNLVYALMLTNSGPATNLGLGLTNSGAAFALGQAYQGGGPGSYFNDWTFSQINVIPNPTIPESSTVAAIFGLVLVAGLVGFRLRQQRQLALAPVLAA